MTFREEGSKNRAEDMNGDIQMLKCIIEDLGKSSRTDKVLRVIEETARTIASFTSLLRLFRNW